MAALEASPGRMIYWARKTVESLSQHNSADNPVKLLRNQAKITLNVDATKTTFEQKGWVVVNSNAFGTVAPYNSEYGGFVPPSVDQPFGRLCGCPCDSGYKPEFEKSGGPGALPRGFILSYFAS